MSEGPKQPQEGNGEQRTLRLEAQLAAVTARVFQLEREVATLRGVAPPVMAEPVPMQAAEPGVLPAVEHEATAAPVAWVAAEATPAPPAAAVLPRTPQREERLFESRVGSQWFNRIGIIAVLVGVALALKYVFDNHWVGPLGRVVIGLLSGAALIAWSEHFRAKGYTGFSYSLKAVGSGVLYLSLWAGFSVYGLFSATLAFAGMVVVTAFNAFIAWRQDAELLAVYAIVGAFSTPLLLATGHNDEVFLFSYLLLMNAATMALLVLKGWNRLLVLSFVGTISFYWGWYFQFYKPAEFTTTAIFVVLFVLLFAAATVLARQKRTHGGHDDAARVLVSLANAAFGFLGFYAMLSRGGDARNITLAWVAVAFAAFYLGVRKLMENTPMAGTSLASISDVQLSIAIVFLTLAVPLALHGHWITVGWMAEGTVLVWLATRMRTGLMRLLAAGALVLGLCSLAMDATIAQTRVLWNTRLLSFAVGTAAMAICAGLARREPVRPDADASARSWRLLAATGATIAHVLVVAAVLFEIHTYWWSGPPPAANAQDLRMAGSVLSSAIWLMVAGAAAAWAAARRSPAALQVEAACWFAIGLILLLMGMVYRQQQVIWNLRFVAFLAAIACVVWLGRQLRARDGRGVSQLRIGASVTVTVLALTAVCFEIATFWATRLLAAAPDSAVYASLQTGRLMAERFSYSAWFLVAGAVLLAVGFRRRSAVLRWQGLVLLVVTICKVFVLDTSTLSQGYRSISFLALGALLLGVSFAYQRDWLHLRAAADAGENQ